MSPAAIQWEPAPIAPVEIDAGDPEVQARLYRMMGGGRTAPPPDSPEPDPAPTEEEKDLSKKRRDFLKESGLEISDSKGKRCLKMIPMGELIQDRRPAPYLVKGVLPQNATSWLYGPSGGGKSFLALDLGCRIASGWTWRENKTVDGGVAYLCGEGADGVKERLALWEQVHESPKNIPLYVSNMGGAVDDPEQEPELYAALDAVPSPLRLVIIDTQSRWMMGDESSTRDAAYFVRCLDGIRERYKCHVLTVHHTGKDTGRGSRGSSVYPGAADVELEVGGEIRDDKTLVSLTFRKVKDGTANRPPLWWELRPEVLEGWINQDGEEVTSCYAVPVEGPPQKSTKPGPNASIPPDQIKRIVMEYPHAGHNELCGLLSDKCKVSNSTAKARIRELLGLGVIISESAGGQKKRYRIAEGHELEN